MASDGSRLGIGAGMGAPSAPRSPLHDSRASQPNDAGAAARASGSATASISGPSDASPYEHASDVMHARGPRSEDDEDEDERGRTLPTPGPSHTRSREPDFDEADIPIAASEAARRRHFKALRTAKACDVCKIRKVKCDGGEPCAACRAHSSACVYSQTTRTRLLSLSAGALSTTSPGTSPQGPPTGNSASSVSSASARMPGQRDQLNQHGMAPRYDNVWYGRPGGSYDGQGTMPARPYPPLDPALYDTRPMLSPNTARSLGMQYPPLDAYSSDSSQAQPGMPSSSSGWTGSLPINPGEYSGWKGSRERTLPAIADFDYHSASGMPRNWGNEPASHHHLGPIQLAPMNSQRSDQAQMGEASRGAAAALSDHSSSDPPGMAPQEPAADDRVPHSSNFERGQSNNQYQELQGEYSASSRRLDRRSQDPLEHVRPPSKRARTHSRQRRSLGSVDLPRHAATQALSRPARSQSVSPSSSVTNDFPRISIDKEHPMGMVAVATAQSGPGVSGIRWWGSTSFLAFQVRLSRLIRIAKRQHRYPQRLSSSGSVSNDSNDASPPNKSLWIWGTDHILLDNPATRSTISPRLDIMFLPSSFADRFLHSYCITVHPLYPFYDLEQIRKSINRRFSGGVSYFDDQDNFVASSPDQKLDHARDLLILAMGARIEGGNGDAHVPKPAAETWAAVLSQRSQRILTDIGFQGGNSGIVKLWTLHCLFSSMLADVEQEYIAAGHAASVCSALGLHREYGCKLAERDDPCARATFFVVYDLENTLSLRLGRPNRMASVSSEVDVLLPDDTDLHKKRLRASSILGQACHGINRIYLDAPGTDTVDKLQKDLDHQVETWRLDLPDAFRNFDRLDDTDPISMDTDAGERAVLNFDLALHFHTAKMQLWFPTLSQLVEKELAGTHASEVSSLRAGAEACVRSASTLIDVFSEYYAKLPYLPFVRTGAPLLNATLPLTRDKQDGHFCYCFLYIVPVLYMSVLRHANESSALHRHLEIARRADRVLEKVDHLASRVARNMIKDLLADFGGETGRPTNPWDSTTLTEMDRKQR